MADPGKLILINEVTEWTRRCVVMKVEILSRSKKPILQGGLEIDAEVSD